MKHECHTVSFKPRNFEQLKLKEKNIKYNLITEKLRLKYFGDILMRK